MVRGRKGDAPPSEGIKGSNHDTRMNPQSGSRGVLPTAKGMTAEHRAIGRNVRGESGTDAQKPNLYDEKEFKK